MIHPRSATVLFVFRALGTLSKDATIEGGLNGFYRLLKRMWNNPGVYFLGEREN